MDLDQLLQVRFIRFDSTDYVITAGVLGQDPSRCVDKAGEFVNMIYCVHGVHVPF